MGTGLYPQVLFLVQCARWAYPSLWTAVALLDGGLLFFYFFCVRLPIVDGTGVFGVVVRKVCLPDCGWDRYV